MSSILYSDKNKLDFVNQLNFKLFNFRQSLHILSISKFLRYFIFEINIET